MVQQRIIVFDLETVPDLIAARALLREESGTSDEDVRSRLIARYTKPGDDPKAVFIKVPLQRIVCIGALYAERSDHSEGWQIAKAGVGHVGMRDEQQLLEGFLSSFQDRPAPQLVGFNSSSFDLPVLRYRALALSVTAPELHRKSGRDYWYRFGRDHLDLCDLLSNFGASARPSLNEMSALCGVPPKLGGVEGGMVESLVSSGRIEEVANYCEVDVVSTYLLFLRYALVAGELTRDSYRQSLEVFGQFINDRAQKRPYLASFAELATSSTGARA